MHQTIDGAQGVYIRKMEIAGSLCLLVVLTFVVTSGETEEFIESKLQFN